MKGIRIAILNIRSERSGVLKAALRALKQGNVDDGVLQETKLMDGIHMWQVSGYAIWATAAKSRHRGGISILKRGCGVTGKGHCQLWTKRGKILADIGVSYIVRRWSVRATKRRASCPLNRTGNAGRYEGNVGNLVRGPQRKANGTARHHGGRSSNGADGQWDGRHDS